MNIRLENKVALITGASRGLGASMAKALAGAGAAVALVGRDTEKLNEVAGAIRAAGGKAEPFRADVTKEADVQQLEQEVSAKLGKVSILINNAGVNCRKNITDFALAEWNSVIVPHTGTTIRVVSFSAQGNFMEVNVNS